MQNGVLYVILGPIVLTNIGARIVLLVGLKSLSFEIVTTNRLYMLIFIIFVREALDPLM